jgi:hypothetical protein
MVVPCETEGCGTTATVDLPGQIKELSVGGRVNVDGVACPSCGGKFSRESGVYKPDENDVYQRVGDYQPKA